MNRHSRTFAAVALALGTLPAAALVHAATDNPPTTPATLTANRYSATGADILWARSTDDKGAVRGYEIVRNGVPLGIRDALSVTEKNLVPGKSYAYSVAAVDSAGQRSTPIRVTLGTKGVSGATSAPTVQAPKPPSTPATLATPPPTTTLAAPTGLRSTAYSGTSGEIGWTRPATAGLRYDVRREGVLLTTTDGTGHVDRGLSPGRDYRYEIVAIDLQGRRSAPANVTLRTQGVASGPAASNPFTPVATTPPGSPIAPAPKAPVSTAPVSTAPVPTNPGASPAAGGFVFSRTDTREFRWITRAADGRLGSRWITESCATRFGGPTRTGNWNDLITLAPAFDKVADPCSGGATANPVASTPVKTPPVATPPVTTPPARPAAAVPVSPGGGAEPSSIAYSFNATDDFRYVLNYESSGSRSKVDFLADLQRERPNRKTVFGEPVSSFPPPSATLDGHALKWSYRAVDDQLVSDAIEAPLSHRLLWERFVTLVPPARRRNVIGASFMLMPNGIYADVPSAIDAQGSNGSVRRATTIRFDEKMTLPGIVEARTGTPTRDIVPADVALSTPTIMDNMITHELGHIMNVDDTLPGTGGVDTPTVIVRDGRRIVRNSEFGRYLEKFWSGDVYTYFQSLVDVGTPRAEIAKMMKAKFRHRFFGDYAATNFDEDFAETFQLFVQLDGPPSSDPSFLAFQPDDKLAWFWNEPALVKLRDQIRAVR